MIVGKHPAPEGALRLPGLARNEGVLHVRKHPAPEGALRHRQIALAEKLTRLSESTQHQKVH